MCARVVDLAGARVTLSREGDGPPLLLLHGDGESRRGWRAVMPRLARAWDVIAPDLPGYGESDRLGDPSPGALAAWVRDLLDELGVPRVAIVGNSLGGLVAVHVARSAPGRVRGLVLVDPAGMGQAYNPLLGAAALPGLGELNVAATALPLSGWARADARRVLLFADPRRAPEWWRHDMRRLTRPDVLSTSVATRRATLGPWGQRTVVLDVLHEVTAPTLVVWGRDDHVFPVSQGRAAAGRLPAGRLVVIPACGHLPHVEWPEPFLAEVEPFLAGLPAPGVAAAA